MEKPSEYDGGLVISWKGGRYYNDIFPKEFFSKSVKRGTDREHGIEFEGGKIAKARCKLGIKGSVATLEYPKGLNGHDAEIEDGVMTIYFKDNSRNIVSRVDFLDSNGRYSEDVAKTNMDDVSDVLEGKSRLAEVRYFSRNIKLMNKAKADKNYTCEACGYRVEVKGIFIVDCHHMNPVSMEGECKSDPKELLVLCPNCHRIAHTGRGKPLSLQKIMKILKDNGMPVAKSK